MAVDADQTKCGKLIVDFANAPSPEEAISNLITNTKEFLGFSDKFSEREKIRMLGSEYVQPTIDWLSHHLETLKRFLREFVKTRNVSLTEDFAHFVILYEFVGRPEILVDDDGSIREALKFNEELFDTEQYTYLIGYCLVSFLLSSKNRKLLNRCEECKKYFVSKKLMEEGKARFCSTPCRLKWHNRKRIKSGEAARYKKEKRREGKYQ